MQKRTVGNLLLSGVLFALVGTLGFGVWYLLFAEHVRHFVQSVSPDGMFRCTVTQRWCRGSRAEVLLEGWKEERRGSDDGPWESMTRQDLAGDTSACRSNYSITWQYDAKHRTTGVTVFGDYGSPPFPGEIIFKMPLGAPEAK